MTDHLLPTITGMLTRLSAECERMREDAAVAAITGALHCLADGRHADGHDGPDLPQAAAYVESAADTCPVGGTLTDLEVIGSVLAFATEGGPDRYDYRCRECAGEFSLTDPSPDDQPITEHAAEFGGCGGQAVIVGWA